MRNTPDCTDDTAFRQTCRHIVRALTRRYSWALLPDEELVEAVVRLAEPGASAADLRRRALHHYTVILYEACRQTENPDRRERAYHELFRYLFRIAYNRWPDLAEDVTQRALLLIYEQMDRCRNPGTFLAFALCKLQHAFEQERQARDDRRPRRGVGQSSVEEDRAGPGSRLEQEERLQVLVEAIQRLPDRRQRKVILLRFFGGLSDEEIGARLGITANNVRVLRHRGLARLRNDEQLREYFEIPEIC